METNIEGIEYYLERNPTVCRSRLDSSIKYRDKLKNALARAIKRGF